MSSLNVFRVIGRPYYTSVVIFYIKISSIVLLFFQAYVEKFTSPVNSFQLFDDTVTSFRGILMPCMDWLLGFTITFGTNLLS